MVNASAARGHVRLLVGNLKHHEETAAPRRLGRIAPEIAVREIERGIR